MVINPLDTELSFDSAHNDFELSLDLISVTNCMNISHIDQRQPISILSLPQLA